MHSFPVPGAMPPYQRIPDACKTTGLSQHFLRQGCKTGTVPHIRSGTTYYINIPALYDTLAKSEGDGGADG